MSITTIEELTAAFCRERDRATPPRSADDIPFTYEAITPEWLSDVLCAAHPGARVVAHRLDTADDGNSNRRRIFIDYNDAGRDAGLPDRVFCKASQGLANRISLGLCGAVAAEVNFYRHVRPLLTIEAPRAYHAAFDPETFNSIIVMADLGDAVSFCTHTTEFTRARAEAQLRLLASFHGRFLDSPELDTRLGMLNTWPAFFGKLDYPAYEQACDQGFGRAHEVVPPRLFARRREIWPATRLSVQRHQELPHTLTHGDDHQRNWYITATGEMGLHDWQAVTRSHWSRDVVYALTTALTIEHRRAWERELLAYYFEHLQQAAGRTLSFDGMFDCYRQQLMSVLAFWTVTLNPAPGMPDMQPQDSTLEFIRRIATAIDDLDVLDAFD